MLFYGTVKTGSAANVYKTASHDKSVSRTLWLAKRTGGSKIKDLGLRTSILAENMHRLLFLSLGFNTKTIHRVHFVCHPKVLFEKRSEQVCFRWQKLLSCFYLRKIVVQRAFLMYEIDIPHLQTNSPSALVTSFLLCFVRFSRKQAHY